MKKIFPAVALVGALLAQLAALAGLGVACSTPAPKSLPQDATQCIASVASTIAGSEDPAQIVAACGATLDDLISWLLNAVTPAQPGQEPTPLQVRYRKLLARAQALKSAR